MRVLIEEVTQGAKGVWTAKSDPQSLIKLAKPVRQGGSLNVVMVTNPSYDANNHSLQFDLDTAVLLNLGNTSEAVIIHSREEILPLTSLNAEPKKQERPPGDIRYLDALRDLPGSLREVGEQLLTEIRKEFPGELVFHPKSKKFVESPDNFWVVRIQPRAQSLRIIVYGRPHEHRRYDSVDLKQDMAAYSNFLIKSKHQVSDAISVIREAKRLKDSR
jgi:hypothetical protein